MEQRKIVKTACVILISLGMLSAVKIFLMFIFPNLMYMEIIIFCKILLINTSDFNAANGLFCIFIYGMAHLHMIYKGIISGIGLPIFQHLKNNLQKFLFVVTIICTHFLWLYFSPELFF